MRKAIRSVHRLLLDWRVCLEWSREVSLLIMLASVTYILALLSLESRLAQEGKTSTGEFWRDVPVLVSIGLLTPLFAYTGLFLCKLRLEFYQERLDMRRRYFRHLHSAASAVMGFGILVFSICMGLRGKQYWEGLGACYYLNQTMYLRYTYWVVCVLQWTVSGVVASQIVACGFFTWSCRDMAKRSGVSVGEREKSLFVNMVHATLRCYVAGFSIVIVVVYEKYLRSAEYSSSYSYIVFGYYFLMLLVFVPMILVPVKLMVCEAVPESLKARERWMKDVKEVCDILVIREKMWKLLLWFLTTVVGAIISTIINEWLRTGRDQVR